MKRSALALVALGLTVAACSKPTATENGSNETLVSENVSDNLVDANLGDSDAGNGSNTAF